MKALSAVFYLSILLYAKGTNAQIRIVNNNTNAPIGHFHTISSAMAASAPGDTIYIMGSPNIYDTYIYPDKPLTFIGPGYRPEKDSAYPARVGDFHFINGHGECKIFGLSLINIGDGNGSCNNLEIAYDYFPPHIGVRLGNGCNFHDNVGSSLDAIQMWGANNSIHNNIFGFTNGTENGITTAFGPYGNISITNNLFISPSVLGIAFPGTLTNATINNNIFYQFTALNPSNIIMQNCDFNYNLTYNTAFNTLIAGSNHSTSGINYIGMMPTFVNPTSNYAFDFPPYDFHLQPASIGYNGGSDGTDIGPFGGPNPFTNYTGMPPIPQVIKLDVLDSVVAVKDSLPVHIITHAHTNSLITAAEFFFDADPGNGNAIPLSGFNGDTIDVIKNIPQNLPTGNHLLGFRVRNANGQWSLPEIRLVKIYDVYIDVVSPPFIRPGRKTKFILRITNSSTKDFVEKYLVIKAPRNFNMELESIGDSINGVSVQNISKPIFVDGDNPHYDLLLWLGKLPKQQSTSYNLYFTFPSLVPHDQLKISYELLGSKKSDMQRYFDNYGNDSTIFRSLYAGSLLNSIDFIKDTLGLGTLSYTILTDSLRSWLKNNNSLFSGLMPINLIPKVYLSNCFNAAFSDSVVNMINLVEYNIFKFSSYNIESVGNNIVNPMNPISSNRSQSNSECNCTSPLSLSYSPSHPLQPEFLFYLSSGCQKRCKCECSGANWQRIDEGTHVAVDLAIWPNVVKSYSDDWFSCEIPVRSMFNGTAAFVNLEDEPIGGYQVWITSTDNNGNVFVVKYLHLCEMGRVSGTVYAGQVIGYVGKTGDGADGVHLHIQSDLPPSCLMNFEAVYPPMNSDEALNDHPCKSFQRTECKYEVEGKCFNSIPFYSNTGTCEPEWKENGTCGGPESIIPGDPNDKIGNKGYAEQHFIKPTEQLHYGIFFENAYSATASAQVVKIVDTLDLSKVDKNTFYLESIIAGEMLVVLPDSMRLENLDTIYKKEKINGTYVRIQATFDTTTGIIQFLLTSLDTLTLQPVTDPLKGFLPPDTSHFHGNGLVNYKVMPKPGIADGTVIYNTGHIVFDANPSIATGTWLNTMDGSSPTSEVDSLQPITYDTSFIVRWHGTDVGAGIIAYDVYSKKPGDTAYTKWLDFTSDTSAVFTGLVDSTYQFYSVAYDSLLNKEPIPLIFDAVTTIKPPTGLPLHLIYFNLSCSGNSRTLKWKTVNDIAGEIYKIETSANGIDWSTIGSIASIKDGDNLYSLTDNVNNGIFYRIKKIDITGNIDYSGILRANCNITHTSIKVYPNPAKNQFNIIVETGTNGKMSLKLYDGHGRVIRSVDQSLQRGTNSFLIDVSNLSAGSYVLKSESNGITKTQKILITH